MGVEQEEVCRRKQQTAHSHQDAKTLVVVGIKRKTAEEATHRQKPQEVRQQIEHEAHKGRTACAKRRKASEHKKRDQQQAKQIGAG